MTEDNPDEPTEPLEDQMARIMRESSWTPEEDTQDESPQSERLPPGAKVYRKPGQDYPTDSPDLDDKLKQTPQVARVPTGYFTRGGFWEHWVYWLLH